jgi:S-(hydroxymethyl)glutathione dehydrogenase/alcohol dehydrogenase
MAQRMRAAILVEQRRPLVVAEIELADALEAGQVLVRMHYSGICGSQLGEIDGAKGPDRFLPHLLGHEGSGTVLAVGPGVSHVRPDDRVVLHWRKGLGIEARPAGYHWEGRTVNAGWVTTFNELAIVSENRVTTIPPDSDMEVAALFGCAVTTGFGVVVNNARVRIGETVVVFGAGGIGLNIVQAAALSSAYPVIAVDLHDGRLELARSLGATHVINARTHDAAREIATALAGRALDVFIDNTGQPAVIELGYRQVHGQGRVILVGVPQAGQDIRIPSLPLHFGKVLTGSHGGEAVPQADIPRYQALYRLGRLRLQELITHRFPLSDINAAIGAMRDGSVSGRCLIAF